MSTYHDNFKKNWIDDLKEITYNKSIIIDVRGIFKQNVEKNGIIYLSL